MSREMFWARLFRHREDVLGVSQDVIAGRLHITQQRVSELEKSATVPDRVERLREIAAAYELEPAVVFAWAAEASGHDARKTRRDNKELRDQYHAALTEMREIVEDNREINAQIGRDIADLRDVFKEMNDTLKTIRDALTQPRGRRDGS